MLILMDTACQNLLGLLISNKGLANNYAVT